MNIPVFFTSKMVADSGCFSPSAAKPPLVVESWKKFPIDILEPEPVTVDDYARAHDRKFVEGVLSCQIDNGFENRSPQVAASLPYTTGSMLAAAKHALTTKKVAVSPTSGFHHAGYKSSEGYCTFNGLMVTALTLKELGLVKRVGILDLDMHYGNGTDDIIRTLQCGRWVEHYTGGRWFKHPSQVKSFFVNLPIIAANFMNCDIVLYQAGADPHIDDNCGGMGPRGWLTTEELRQRDAIVFDVLSSYKVPVAWNLAGGYQKEPDGTIPKVLEIHDNTMKECVRVYG